MMKKLAYFFIGVILLSVVFLSACANNSTSKSQNQASTEGYPNRQIELVVPFAAGGGVDLTARAVADYLSKE